MTGKARGFDESGNDVTAGSHLPSAHAKPSSTTPPVHHRHHAHQASRASLSLDEPGLRSSAALILDETHSTVLYSRHADVAMPIASISKLVTALTVADANQARDEGR